MKTYPDITLRALEPSDLDCLYIWENLPEIRKHGSIHAPLSRHQLWEYIRTYDADPMRCGQLRLMVMAGTTPVGTIDLFDIDPCNRNACIGIMIEPGSQRKGYGKKALSALCGYCRDSLGLRRLAAMVSLDNEPSLAVFRAAGFTSAGTLKEWVRRPDGTFADTALLQIALCGRSPQRNGNDESGSAGI